MNRDEYDDDLDQVDIDDEAELELDDTDDTEDERHVVPDGGRVRVPITAMDSTQRAIYDAANHRPGWRTPERVGVQDQVVADAYNGYVRFLKNAHKTPSMTAADAKPKPRARSLTDAQQAAEQAYREYVQYLVGAHKQGRQP